MSDVGEDVLLLNNRRLWKPPVPLKDCSSEYLKDNPVPSSLLKNPFKIKKDKCLSVELERQIWARLGLLCDIKNEERKAHSSENGDALAIGATSLYYAKSVPPTRSTREVQRDRKAQKTVKLSKWFDLPRGDFSQENKEDLEIIAKRDILFPALHSRKPDGKKSHFQVGTVVDDPASFHDRIARKQRRKNLVDELLANAEYMRKQRRQYAALQKGKQELRAAFLRKKKQQKRSKSNTIELKRHDNCK